MQKRGCVSHNEMYDISSLDIIVTMVLEENFPLEDIAITSILLPINNTRLQTPQPFTF